MHQRSISAAEWEGLREFGERGRGVLGGWAVALLFFLALALPSLF